MSTLTQPAPPPPYRTPLDLAARSTTVERSSYAGVRSLVVDGAADIRLTSAPAGARLEVAARITKGLWEPAHRAERDAGGTLRLSASCSAWRSSSCRVRSDLRVPAGAEVRARTGAGDVDARDLRSTAPVVLHSSAGDVDLRGATAPSLRLTSSAGDVAAEGVRAARVRAHSSAGDVELALLQPADRLDASSSAGDVELAVPDAIYRLDARSSAGDVRRDDVRTDPASPRTLRAESSAGDVEIRVIR